MHPRGMQSWCHSGRNDHEVTLNDPLLEATKRKGNLENGDDESSKGVQRTRRRVNRPGYNSYLKVGLDDFTMNKLHQMAKEIQKRLVIEAEKDSLAVEAVKGTQEERCASIGNYQKTKPLRFKPRSRQSLHMTFFFGGETLCRLPPEELLQWHQRVAARLAQSGFMLSGHSPTNNADDKDKEREEDTDGNHYDYSFYVQGLKVFPPRRNNLIVAILEPTVPHLWNDLYRDIRQIAQDESCSKELAEVTKFSNPGWVAHVTLGNVYGGTKSDMKSLDHNLLDDVFCQVSTKQHLENTTTGPSSRRDGVNKDHTHFQAYARSISMGGPLPEQVELDWEFHFQSSC